MNTTVSSKLKEVSSQRVIIGFARAPCERIVLKGDDININVGAGSSVLRLVASWKVVLAILVWYARPGGIIVRAVILLDHTPIHTN